MRFTTVGSRTAPLKPKPGLNGPPVPLLAIIGYEGGLIHSLIRNPEADRTRYVGFRLASSKATSKLYDPARGKKNLANSP